MLACKNCSNEFSGKFCNDCGQPGDTYKIDRRFVMLELRKTFIHFWDDGLFYTVKSLFINPGNTIKDYLDGKRIRHIKPFTFLIMVVGLYVLLSQYFHLHVVLSDIEGHKAEELNSMLYTHYSQVQLLLLLVYSGFSVLFFSYTHYNFYEFLVIHTFLAGQRILIAIVLTIPVLALIKDPAHVKPAIYLTSIPGHVLMIWAYCCLFKDRQLFKVIGKVILIMLLSLFTTALIIALLILFLWK